jgi:hypothetical protein
VRKREDKPGDREKSEICFPIKAFLGFACYWNSTKGKVMQKYNCALILKEFSFCRDVFLNHYLIKIKETVWEKLHRGKDYLGMNIVHCSF